MRNILNSIVAFLFTCGAGAALAVVEEGNKLAPEPQVSVGWVIFFLLFFVAICVGIGYAIWRTEKKNNAAGPKADGNKG